MKVKSRMWYLENFNLFEGMSNQVMMDLSTKVTEMTPTKNQYVYFPQDASKYVFFLKEGRIKIGEFSDDGRENIKAILHPGEAFGELALAGQESRSDFAQAMDNETLICALGVSEMEDLMNGHNQIGIKVTRLIGFRLQKTERKLSSLIFKDARTRFIEFLSDLAKERGQKVGSEILIKHALTHKDMANLTATSRQTVTTILNELKERNLINFERKRIIIREIEKLK